MNICVLLLLILFSTNVVQAGLVKARGAAPRKHFAKAHVDIEDLIRAEDDPNFLQYVRDRELEEKLEKTVELEAEKQRQAEAAAYEKARIEYVKNKKVIPEDPQQDDQLAKEQKAWDSQQEQYRKEYLDRRQKFEEKHNAERMARMQKVFSQERMPASDH